MTILKHGDTIQAPYVLPHPTKRNEFVAEIRPAIVRGFSHPSVADRDWGWRGSVLAEFSDGSQSWTDYNAAADREDDEATDATVSGEPMIRYFGGRL